MTATIHHEVRHDHLRAVLAERRRLGIVSRAAVARQGQDAERLGAQHDRASRRARQTTSGGTHD